MNLKKQSFFLCVYEALRGFRIAGAIWVVLLLGRGFSLAEVGAAEGVFHTVSFLCEVPSGMLADLMGRRRTLVCSGLVNAFAGIIMALSTDWPGICLAMGLEAFGFNLASGTLEAISYDSLVQAGDPADFVKWDSRQYTVYSVFQALASLASFITVRIGFRGAYLAAAAIGVCASLAAGQLTEPVATQAQARRTRIPLRQWPRKLWDHTLLNFHFLLEHRRLAAKMLCISLVAAAGYLMQMFWQQHLVEEGLPAAWVGTPLFLLMLMDVAGAMLARKLPGRLRTIFLWLGLPVAACTALAGLPGLLPSLLFAGCSSLLDSAFLVRASSLMQPFYPSDSRATLTSVDSMMYSMCMVPLSPLAGLAADRLGTGLCLGLVGLGLALAILCAVLLQRKQAFPPHLNKKRFGSE